MAILSVTGPGLWSVILVLSLWWGITGSRVIRSAAISTRENVHVQAAVATGCSTVRIIFRHILPNVMAAVVILAAVRVSAAILVEASLSFLGLGVPPPAASWGGMLSGDARRYMFEAPWMALWPGLVLSISVFGTNMFGDAVRDLLDPRLRGGVGRYGRKVKKKLFQ
jgi:peptide/nickel transport system permease protein